MIEWGVMFKSVSFFLLVLNIVFIFVEFNEKKGIGKRGATKTGKTNTHCGFDFLRLQEQKVERNFLSCL